MSSAYVMRAARALRVFCPVEPQTLSAMLAADGSAIERDKHVAEMVRIIRSGSALGDFGIYKSVIEISPGWELFTSGADAAPTLEESGSSSTSPTAILTIYIAEEAPTVEVDAGIAAILKAHPWEVPVLEMFETSLLLRKTR
jgi:hypothetical protein